MVPFLHKKRTAEPFFFFDLSSSGRTVLSGRRSCCKARKAAAAEHAARRGHRRHDGQGVPALRRAAEKPQLLMPQPEPQQDRRRSQQVGQQHRRLRTAEHASGVRTAGDGKSGIDDARQELHRQKEQQVQQGLAHRGQNALDGICAFGLHMLHSFLLPQYTPPAGRCLSTSGCIRHFRRKTAQPQVVTPQKGRENTAFSLPLVIFQIFRSQAMLMTARPPTRTVTASPPAYRRLRISEGRCMCSPCRNTFSSSGCTMPWR